MGIPLGEGELCDGVTLTLDTRDAFLRPEPSWNFERPGRFFQITITLSKP
jgi:hypothetical protein